MEKYIKKPVSITAIEWDGQNLFDVVGFIEGKKPDLNCDSAMDAWQVYSLMVDTKGLIIKTLEGDHLANIGDMIIKGVKGEFYPCKPDIFKLTYYTEEEYAELIS